MSKQSEAYSQHQAEIAGLTLERLGIKNWSAPAVQALQTQHGISPADGWLGPATIAALVASKKSPIPPTDAIDPGELILDGKGYAPPPGVKVVNFQQPGGLKASAKAIAPRLSKYRGVRGVTQMIIHRGSTVKVDEARHTFRVLEAQGYSTVFIMGLDGVIYQTLDPAIHRGRHATHHNDQSDAIDVAGPLMTRKDGADTPGVAGQEDWAFQMAIGTENDGKPPLSRRSLQVHQWSPTPAQQAALAVFLPWWCALRGIPLTACSDYRCYRAGGLGPRDPVTNLTGILAHVQVSGPGQRVDGAVELESLRRSSENGKIPKEYALTWTSRLDI